MYLVKAAANRHPLTCIRHTGFGNHSSHRESAAVRYRHFPPKHPCCSVSLKIRPLQFPKTPLRLLFPKHPPCISFVWAKLRLDWSIGRIAFGKVAESGTGTEWDPCPA